MVVRGSGPSSGSHDQQPLRTSSSDPDNAVVKPPRSHEPPAPRRWPQQQRQSENSSEADADDVDVEVLEGTKVYGHSGRLKAGQIETSPSGARRVSWTGDSDLLELVAIQDTPSSRLRHTTTGQAAPLSSPPALAEDSPVQLRGGGDQGNANGKTGPLSVAVSDLGTPPRSQSSETPLKNKKLLNLNNINEIMTEIALEMEGKRDKSLKRRVFGIGPRLGSLPASDMIHPFSPFARVVTTISGLFLFYTALVTPFVIGFFWDEEACYRLPILEFDMTVDSFFLAEIFFTFSLGVFHEGVYVHNYRRVARKYLGGMFCFDLVTSIPVSYVEFFAIQTCSQGEAGFDPQATRMVRLIKPFRLFRVLRLIRNQKLLVIFDYLESLLKLPPFAFKMVRLFALILGMVHLCACFFWLVKVASNEDADFEMFLADNNLSRESSRVGKYMVSFYFINTVFTTVGFGDIAATNTEERGYLVVVMYIGTIIFGMLLTEVDTAVSYLRRFARKRGHDLQVLLDFLRSKHVPVQLERDIMEWVEFDWDTHEDVRTTEYAMELVPDSQLYELQKHLHSNRLLKVPLFAGIKCAYKDQFLVDVWMIMQPQTFCKSKVIVGPDEELDRMFMIRSGTVRVISLDQTDTPGSDTPKSSIAKGLPRTIEILRPGDSFGSYALMGDTNAGRAFDCDRTQFTAGSTYVDCLVLTREEFAALIDKEYPDEVGEAIRQDLEDHMMAIRNRNDDDDRKMGGKPMKIRVLASWSMLIAKLMKKMAIGSDMSAAVRQTIGAGHTNKATAMRKSKSIRAAAKGAGDGGGGEKGTGLGSGDVRAVIDDMAKKVTDLTETTASIHKGHQRQLTSLAKSLAQHHEQLGLLSRQSKEQSRHLAVAAETTAASQQAQIDHLSAHLSQQQAQMSVLGASLSQHQSSVSSQLTSLASKMDKLTSSLLTNSRPLPHHSPRFSPLASAAGPSSHNRLPDVGEASKASSTASFDSQRQGRIPLAEQLLALSRGSSTASLQADPPPHQTTPPPSSAGKPPPSSSPPAPASAGSANVRIYRPSSGVLGAVSSPASSSATPQMGQIVDKPINPSHAPVRTITLSPRSDASPTAAAASEANAAIGGGVLMGPLARRERRLSKEKSDKAGSGAKTRRKSKEGGDV